MKGTRRALLAAALPAPLLGSACGAGGLAGGPAASAPEVRFGEPVAAVFWHSQTGASERALSDLVSRFNAQNGKNITLRGEFQGTPQQVFQKTVVALQAGSPPEAATAFESMVQEFARAGALVDLDGYLTGGASPLTRATVADFFPAYLEGGRLASAGRRLLAFPFAKSLAVQYANEDLLAGAGLPRGAPPTLEGFKRQAAAVTRKDAAGKTTLYGQHIRVDASYVSAFILANGGQLLNTDGTKVRFNEAPGLEVFEMWDALVKAGQAYAAQGFGYQADFGQGKVAGVHDTTASRSFIAGEVVEKGSGRERFRWSIGAIPQQTPEKPSTVAFGAGAAVFRSVPLRQAAVWEWLRFLSEPEQTAEWSVASGYMPLRRSAADLTQLKELWQKSPQAEQAFRLAATARTEPTIAAWPGIREALQLALGAVVAQRQAPRAALDEAARRATELIQEKP